MSVSNLLIELYFSDGQIDRIKTHDSDQARLLIEQLNPSKVFSGPPLTISEDQCLTTYRLQSVVRIDISGSDAPNWPYMGNAASITEVSEEHFQREGSSDEIVRKRLDAWNKPGTTQEGFTVLTLSNGQRIIWQVNMSSAEMIALDAGTVARNLFNAGALHGRSRDGAIMIVNMAHVRRLSFFPGPTQVSGRIAKVERV